MYSCSLKQYKTDVPLRLALTITSRFEQARATKYGPSTRDLRASVAEARGTLAQHTQHAQKRKGQPTRVSPFVVSPGRALVRQTRRFERHALNFERPKL